MHSLKYIIMYQGLRSIKKFDEIDDKRPGIIDVESLPYRAFRTSITYVLNKNI